MSMGIAAAAAWSRRLEASMRGPASRVGTDVTGAGVNTEEGHVKQDPIKVPSACTLLPTFAQGASRPLAYVDDAGAGFKPLNIF